MTKEEAIICLKGIKNYGRDTFTEQSDWQYSLDIAIKALEQQTSEDCVSLGVYNQVAWERDIAIEQLKELGYELGEKIRTSDDCVSRADLLKIYEDRFIELQKVHQQDKQLGVNWCINTLKDMPPVTPTQRWIPVSERLPKKGQRVFVTQIVRERTVVYCTTFPFDKIKEEYIIAWMPLPKPYEEKIERGNKNETCKYCRYWYSDNGLIGPCYKKLKVTRHDYDDHCTEFEKRGDENGKVC